MKPKSSSLGLSYINTQSPIHKLNGITKFALFVSWITVVLTTFDLRIICVLILVGLGLLKLTRIPFSLYKPFLIATIGVLSMNALFMFLLAPQQGTVYLKSHTVLIELWSDYSLTSETLFYLINVTLKYFSMFPIALVFVFSTHPTEFAASLNRLGVPAKIAYAVSLTLRYLPEIKKDFVNIMHAQQARGIDFSSKTPFFQRVKNLSLILGPLLFSSLDRADEISNAMLLRGFGRHKSRTWYSEKALTKTDWIVLSVIIIITGLAIVRKVTETQLFWYPF